MKKTITSVALLLLLALCGCSERSNKTSETNHQTDIVGKEAVLTYPTMTATVKYLSENQLHWQTTDKDGNTEEGTESLSYKRIDGQRFFLNWIEKDGTTVSQVLDLNTMTVSVYMSYADNKGRGGRAADFFEGTVRMK